MKGICKHCGADYGLHQWETLKCPKNGVEAPITQKQFWEETTFTPASNEPDLHKIITKLQSKVDSLEKEIRSLKGVGYANPG